MKDEIQLNDYCKPIKKTTVMETQTISTGTARREEGNGTFKKGMALAGSAALGAGAVVAADMVKGSEEPDVVDPAEPIAEVLGGQDEQANGSGHDAVAATMTTAQAGGAHEAGQQVAATHTDEPQPQGPEPATPTEPEPDTTVADAEIATDDIPDVDPTLVAQNITDDIVMVDPTDIDAGNMDIAAVGTIETVDGQTLTAAQFTGDNGETLYMVDVDNDNMFDVVADEAGNIMAEVPTTVTVSDTENLIGINNGDPGYLAQNEHDNTIAQEDSMVSDPMNDVVDLA